MLCKYCNNHGCDDCMDISIAFDINNEKYPGAGFYKGKFIVSTPSPETKPK